MYLEITPFGSLVILCRTISLNHQLQEEEQ